MENLSRVFQKQKRKKKQGEIEFHNSVQDWVFTTVIPVLEKCYIYVPKCYILSFHSIS